MLIAFDPGQTTGIAIKALNKYFTLNTTDPKYIWTLLASFKWKAVIYETFETSGLISKYGLHTVELVGGIRAVCIVMGWPSFEHYPTMRRPWLEQAHDKISDVRKKVIVHEMDALAHLLAYEALGK